MKTFVITSLFTLLSICAIAQSTFRLSGKVCDEQNSPLVGAFVTIKELPTKGVVSKEDGSFEINLPQGKYTIEASYLGYNDAQERVNIDNEQSITFKLSINTLDIGEVTVSSIARDERVRSVQIGVEKILIEEMLQTPAIFGERDIIKSITLLPGVKADGDGSSGFQVRGGTASQNLIMLDDAPIYNSGHIMGLFSVFNDDALSSASLYKGLIPAQYGGGTSSVFDIQTRVGNKQDYIFGADIGLLSAKVSAEGPIVKDKLSFFVTARRSYFDLFIKAVKKYKDNVMNFYDLNAKVNYNIGKNDRLEFSLFSGGDNLGIIDVVDMYWGNISPTLDWFHRYNKSLTSNTTLILSNYSSENEMDFNNTENFYDGFIKTYGIKHNFVLSLVDSHKMDFGVQSNIVDLKSAEWLIYGVNQKEQRKSWANSVWFNDEFKISKKLSASLGLRFNTFSALGGSPYYILDDKGDIVEELDYAKGKIVKTYYHLEPRASFNYRVKENQSIKVGYSRTSQNIHAIRNSATSMPFDRYTMTSNIIKPQMANQVAIGYSYITDNQKYEFSVEGYYKNIENVYDYKEGKSFNSAIEIERILLGGEGRSYGVEFFAKKSIGRFTGWVGYTLSWSQNKIDGINNNNWYFAGNDRRHDVSVVGMYQLSDKWSVSATWVYNTGQALTAPSAKYDINGETIYYYAERNGYRAPSYNRLDVSFTNSKKHKKYTREWSFGLYNLYNRYNPFMVRFENDSNSVTGTKAMQYSLFGILPSVNFGIKF